MPPATEDESAPDWWRALLERDADVIPLLPAGTRSPAQSTVGPPKSGILVVDKPSGLTSHDVVQRIRRAADERRVGHAGTLDPLATGVLVVCLGSATRVVEAIQAGRKRYLAVVRFGVETTTYDAEGEIVESRDASGLTRADVEEALEAFRGPVDQVPPMYSALKHRGRPLYEWAREGKDVAREARRVTVHALSLGTWEPPDATLEMEVSKGFYVRSLAHDLGEALGVGAHLLSLRRTAVGPFEESAAIALEKAEEAFAEGWWPRTLFALDHALLDHAAIVIDAETEEGMRNGQQFEGPPPTPSTTETVRVYNRAGLFVGLVHWDAVTERWQPERVFPRPAARPGAL